MRKQLLLILALVLTAMGAGAQSFNIGGHRAAVDSLNNIWLCSVPQSLFGTDFTAQITFDDELTNVVIEDVPVASGDTFTFTGIEGGKQYAVTAYIGDSLITGGITFTWLPVVELNGSFNNSYKVGTVTVSEPDSAYAEPMLAKLKWRGGATNAYGKHKRNYRIKFIAEDSTKVNHRFFGLRNDNNWILDAGQMDFLRVRNRVSTDLWLDMARLPYYADTLTNVHNGSRGQMVEVLLNGKYVGIYNMCEPIDRKQLKIKRYETLPNKKYIYHGQLWTSFKWSRTVTMSDPAPRTPGSTIWDGFELKYPDFDETRTVKWTDLERAVWFANRADGDLRLRRDSMEYYFDIPVMQDYFIFIVALQALDNESKNIYYATYDIAGEDKRLTMVPWDLDICLGQNFMPSVDYPEMVRPDRELDWISHLPMVDMMEIEYYGEQVNARYAELRQTVLSTESLINRFRTAINNLEDCGAAAREEDRWSGDTDLDGKTLDLRAELEYVESWITARMAYLDENIFVPRVYPPIPDDTYPVGDVNGDGTVNIADVNAVISIILGATAAEDVMQRADVNGDGSINIADLNAIIAIILG